MKDMMCQIGEGANRADLRAIAIVGNGLPHSAIFLIGYLHRCKVGGEQHGEGRGTRDDLAFSEKPNVTHRKLYCSSSSGFFPIHHDVGGLGILPNPKEIIKRYEYEATGVALVC